MTPAEPEAAGQLQRALAAFRRAQGALLTAHNRQKIFPVEQADWFRIVQGNQLERQFHAAATEVIAATKATSAADLIAKPNDQHLIDTVRRYINEAIE